MASAKDWLFPTHPQSSRTPKDLIFTDPALNTAQKSAIYDIVTLSSNVPYLISGPPGVSQAMTPLIRLGKQRPLPKQSGNYSLQMLQF